MSNSIETCDICGLTIDPSKNESNQFVNQSFKCVSCNQHLLISMETSECIDLLNELEDLRLNLNVNVQKELEKIQLLMDGIQTLKSMNLHKRTQMISDNDYLNLYHVAINAKIIRNGMKLLNRSYDKVTRLISYNEYFKHKSLHNMMSIEETKKSFLDQELNVLKSENMDVSIKELNSCLLELNRAKMHMYKHELRMKKLIEFVPSDDMKKIGKFRIHKTSLLFEESGYYEGQVKNGIKHGYGIKIDYEDGFIYEGEFNQDDYHGHGSFSWFNRTKYVGDFFRNKMTGEGTCYVDCVKTYEGEFFSGEPCGEGIRYDVDEKPVNGLWYYGQLVKKIFK